MTTKTTKTTSKNVTQEMLLATMQLVVKSCDATAKLLNLFEQLARDKVRQENGYQRVADDHIEMAQLQMRRPPRPVKPFDMEKFIDMNIFLESLTNVAKSIEPKDAKEKTADTEPGAVQ